MAERPFRLLPRVTPENEHFWKGGGEGRLQLQRCAECSFWVHPPSSHCPECLTKELRVEAVSGRAEVVTWTVNHQPWIPGFDPPYVVAIVELAEQKGLRLTTNIVGCAHDAVKIGLPVRVRFEEYDDVWLPLFEPEP